MPFLAMVFDQCTDAICDQTGYLDFDVYNELQPVFNGEPGDGVCGGQIEGLCAAAGL